MSMLAARQVMKSKLPSNVIQISLERLVFSSNFLASHFFNPLLGNVTTPNHANYGMSAKMLPKGEELNVLVCHIPKPIRGVTPRYSPLRPLEL